MSEEELKKVKQWVKKEISGTRDLQHGWGHLERVAENARVIVGTLKLENKMDTNLLQATCYLHDINRAYFSPTLVNYIFETRNSKSVLPKVLTKLNVGKKEKRLIENAIYSSSFSFPFRRLNRNGNLYTKVLQDADTLDFFSTQRELDFQKSKKSSIFYAFLGLFSKWALNYGRKNLSNYLNFPEIAYE